MERNKELTFLFVTANPHENNAVKNSSIFKYQTKRSNDPHNTDWYNVGMFGKYPVIHFNLQQQGSVKTDAAILSISDAIQEFSPDAVILVGISFGKENPEDGNTESEKQPIGTVLISEKVADYESGKEGIAGFESDGAIPEAGRQLLSVFKQYAPGWQNADHNHNRFEIGTILSGDKLSDNPSFKSTLFERYPRAIGGEMEGRGAYSVCRRRGLHEWIIVKAIADYGNGEKSFDKESRQQKAAQAAVSLLEYIFSDENSFSQFGKSKSMADIEEKAAGRGVESSPEVVGYCVNFGLSSCRLFQILKDEARSKKGVLKEYRLITYDNSNPGSSEYFDEILKITETEIKPLIRKDGNPLFFKAFADASFNDIFKNIKQKNKFIDDMYDKTGLFFNVLSQKQTEDNLKALFRSMGDIRAIINIGEAGLEILANVAKPGSKNARYQMINVDFPLKEVQEFAKKENIGAVWNESDIVKISQHIKEKLETQKKGSRVQLDKIHAEKVVIIKNELEFMQSLGYDLRQEEGRVSIDYEVYKENNREKLFCTDYEKNLRAAFDEKQVKRLYGFRFGHILMQTFLGIIGAKTIIPSNEISIHGSGLAYIFNVTVSGSTKGENLKYMLKAVQTLKDRGLIVLSPKIVNGNLTKKDKTSHRKHANAIRECDLLFVCNGNGYIGQQTSREIYGAYIANKPIAFWKEPTPNELSEDSALNYIPHEVWSHYMPVLDLDLVGEEGDE